MNLHKLIFGDDGLTRVCDMAYSRDDYSRKCVSLFDPMLIHLCKICAFPNGNVKHWKDEVHTFVSPLFDGCIKKDGTGKIRKKCFANSFVYGLFEEDFSGYPKVKSYFNYAIRGEGKNPKDYNIQTLVDSNQDRIVGFFQGLLSFPKDITPEDASEKIDELLENF